MTDDLAQRFDDRTLTVPDRIRLAELRRRNHRRPRFTRTTPDPAPTAPPNRVDALQTIAENVREVLPGFRVRLADGTVRLVNNTEMNALHHYPCESIEPSAER